MSDEMSYSYFDTLSPEMQKEYMKMLKGIGYNSREEAREAAEKRWLKMPGTPVGKNAIEYDRRIKKKYGIIE